MSSIRYMEMDFGIVRKAWGARRELLSYGTPRYSVYHCPVFKGFSIADRLDRKWGGLWESRKAAWDWIDGICATPFASIELRQSPFPCLLDLQEAKAAHYLDDHPMTSVSQASGELGVPIGLVYRAVKAYGINLERRRRKRNGIILELVKRNPECTPKEIASTLNIPLEPVYSAALSAGLTPLGLLAKKRKRILQDLRTGFLWREIRERWDTNDQLIRSVAKEHGIHSLGRSRGRPRKPPLSKEKDREAARLLRDTSMTYGEIARELSLPWKSALTRIAKKYGLRRYRPLCPLESPCLILG
jgi:hypothetical protein